MRLRALVASLVLLLLSAVIFTSGSGRGAAPAGPAPRATTVPAVVAPLPMMPLRNLFEFGEAPAPVPAVLRPVRPAPVAIAPPVEPLPEAPVHPVRLVGFVRRGGGLQAAIAVRGSVYVLAVGEEAEGYVLLSADEDGGIRVQDQEGAVLTLPPP